MPTKTIKELSLHKKLTAFFSDTALATHGFRPMITGKDTMRLKKVLDLNIFNQTKMEQLMLYYLADRNYKNLGPSMACMFSATILNSLRSKAINRTQFYKELDEYATRYLFKGQLVRHGAAEREDRGPSSMAELLKNLIGNIPASNRTTAPPAPKRKAADLFDTFKN